tara:strand:+ start:248 stop:466 length:219 start_codon:yes stop_codon:yes gene_type:complete
MDTKEISRKWSPLAASLTKPSLNDACEVIENLCLEITRLEKEVKYQEKRQDNKEIIYKDMMIELQNVVSKYI